MRLVMVHTQCDELELEQGLAAEVALCGMWGVLHSSEKLCEAYRAWFVFQTVGNMV